MSKEQPFLFLLLILLVANSCQLLKNTFKQDRPEELPEIQREFRAAWVATVTNINWPSAPGLPVEQQQEEAIALLDLLQKNNFNAVIFQVRPQADALYKSDLELWSYYLTGQQGLAPDPYYDPLAFWIEEAHQRNLELHVWLNPYRAHHMEGGPISEQSVVNTKRELVKPLDSGYWWFDPSLKATQDHSHAVVMDIVGRYDIDGVHFDDYFYPYPSYHFGKDFPDEESWQAYQASGGKLSRADWRRNAVNTFIERVYTSIKKEKPYVKFGLSPFGVWRPGHPASVEGFDQYNELYADAKKWLNEGWVDYFAPQLYWPINQVPQSFPVLLNWWSEQNHENRHLWPGISIGRFEGEKQMDEVINLIMITRGMLVEAPGIIHWSIHSLVNNDTLQQELIRGPYAQKALIPPMHWIKHKTPENPDLVFEQNVNHVWITINEPEEMKVFSNWVVYARYGSQWETIILNRNTSQVQIPTYRLQPAEEHEHPLLQKVEVLNKIYVSTVNRFGIESPPAAFSIFDIP